MPNAEKVAILRQNWESIISARHFGGGGNWREEERVQDLPNIGIRSSLIQCISSRNIR